MTLAQTATTSWRIGPAQSIPLDRPCLIGVLNVTPDSFSDGGRFTDPDVALGQSVRMIEEGARMIDIGGESTRPGAVRIGPEVQITRVLPVIEHIRATLDAPISVDTTSAAVARAALDAGADVINDVSAGREDDGMFALAAKRECGVILMHRLRPPQIDSYSHEYEEPPHYNEVVETVRAFLDDRIAHAEAAGIARESIVIDPGLGFGKTVRQNYELIARIEVLRTLGCPVLSGASRKSFIGHISRVADPSRRLMGSAAVSVAMYLAGVRVFRVHDVAAHREALAIAEAIVSAGRRKESV